MVYIPVSLSGAQRLEDHWLFDLSGQPILQLVLDFQVTLVFESFRITIEKPFVLEHPGGAAQVVEPGGDFEQLSPVLPLSRSKVIAEARAFDDGRLEVLTQDGYRLRVLPNESPYESWNITGPDGLLIVSIPGGKLTIFGTDL